ncbi:MAG TPA: helicase-associated domain-containing protein [Kofleriaceae bacterium]|jgi:hypothetical protein|nr:helicase-associated domain-containing protein [Kofleriaceae bacterium]
MRSSTELRGAWQLQDIPDDVLADFLRIPRPELRGRREVLDRQMRDPVWIAATLEGLPAAALAILHLVIEAGGLIPEHHLADLAERFGLSERDCAAATHAAIQCALAVPLMSRSQQRMIAAVQPAAALVAPLVAGVDLLELPAAELVAAESPARNPRVFLAVCAAARHTEIKLTASGQIHRTSVKRLARQVGVDDASLDALLRTGLRVGVLAADGEVVRPDLAALAAAAEGRYPRYPALAELAAQLGDAALDGRSAAALVGRSLPPGHASLPYQALGDLPGFAVGTVKGVEACRRQPPGGAAAGHVTPSFEVFLPPGSRLIDVVHVGGCCEWERLDRAFVARITRPSIARAVSAGETAEQILARLAAASRHPIPQNVETAIRDWAGGAVSATIATGHVIVVDASARARVAPALARFAARELAPGVFLVDEDARIRDVVVALGRAGVQHREAAAGSGGATPGSAAGSTAVPVEPARETPAAARLRARVSAWRRGEPFEGVRDDFLEKHRAAHPALPVAVPGCSPRALFERWAAKIDPRVLRDLPRLEAITSIANAIPESELEALLEDSRDLDDLVARFARLAARHTRPPPSRSSPGTGARRQRPPALLWQTEDLRERLRRAGQHGEALALDLATGVRYVEISRVMQRGATWMVLGDDLASADAVALRLDAIRAVAALPDDFDITSDALDDDLDEDDDPDDDAPPVRRPWRPAEGQAAPPGHVLCPCGSGDRYRKCCRAVVTA